MTPRPKELLRLFPLGVNSRFAKTTSLSLSGIKEQRLLHSSSGSMGSTDVGKYQELPLSRASLSKGDPGRT